MHKFINGSYQKKTDDSESGSSDPEEENDILKRLEAKKPVGKGRK